MIETVTSPFHVRESLPFELTCLVNKSNKFFTLELKVGLHIKKRVANSPNSRFTSTTDRWPTWHTILLYNTIISILNMFRANSAHHQEISCINTASGIVILCKWPSGMQFEKEILCTFSTCIADGHLQRVTIPDAVLIQLTSWWWALFVRNM